MLRGELLEILNSGNAWAFIGSGPSIDSGLPSWEQLVKRVVLKLEASLRQDIETDPIYEKAIGSEAYARCFSRIEHYIERDRLERLVKEEIDRPRTPSDLMKLVLDLPFAAYVTTNYDPLLERALVSSGQGWIPVGNTPDEVRKISGSASQIVWHVHGCVTMSASKSRLVLTAEDYDDLYLNESPVVRQLRGVLTNHRVVVIGFGFRDPEMMRILKKVGRLSNPAKPIHAFVGGLSGAEHASDREELLHQYNVDVISYESRNTHRQLQDILGVYGALVLRRSVKFNFPARPCPSYDPETTGLLLYNEFCLRPGASISEDVLGGLLRARILSILRYKSATESELVSDLANRASLIRKDRSPEDISVFVRNVLQELTDSDLISCEETREFELTQHGVESVSSQAATAERLSSQFTASLKSRSLANYPDSAEGAFRVAGAAESFLKECIEKKALGVAMTRFASRAEEQSFHMTALLQGLPKYMSQLNSQEEAVGLTKVVQGILSTPSVAEARFIGLALQAQFGVHLLGYDQSALQARTRDLTNTFFLIDSSTLIQALARSSRMHPPARLLLETLRKGNGFLGTTNLFASEVAEHARYAASTADPNTGRPTTKTLEAAIGKAGEWLNAFIDGFMVEASRGSASDLHSYLNAMLGSGRADDLYAESEVEEVLAQQEVSAYRFEKLGGFTSDMYEERDSIQERIAENREKRGTYKHERQVKAEAEALLIIRGLRNKKFTLGEHAVANAFFVSHTRVIDEVAEGSVPITMRPESALQWITTIRPCPVDELSVLANNLLWELSERDLSFIDESKLKTTFSPLIDLSREKLSEELDRHHALIATMYGEDGIKAFRHTQGLDVPIVLQSLYAQKAKHLEQLYEQEKRARISLQGNRALTERERREFEILRAEKRQRELKAKSRKRAAASRKKSRKKKKKR